MSVKLLNDSSFGLVRTNPKLSTNVKLIVDSEYKLYLESFDANKELSNSKYKAFQVDPNSSYSRDLYSFYNNGKFPAELAYSVFQKNSDLTVFSDFSAQHDGFYSAGTKIINSKFYKEELGMFAPIWLNDNIPNYFIIFKVKGAVNINNYNSINENIGFDQANNPLNFKKHILDNSTIIKTFDLRENSSIGKYIRNYYKDTNFPTSPITISFRKDELSTWNGISYNNGIFSKKGEIIYDEFVSKDKSIIENEYYFTKGFEKNKIVCANLLNLQFLFNDETSNDYEFNRYFGMYANEVEEGNFTLDFNKFYRTHDSSQSPKINSVLNSETLSKDVEQYNSTGVNIYCKEIDTKYELPRYSNIKDLASVFYIKDKFNSFYKIKADIAADVNSLKISNDKLNLKYFSGLSPFQKTYIPASLIEEIGYSSYTITVNNNNIPNAFIIKFYDNKKYSFEIACDDILSLPRENNYQYFSNKGTLEDIAISLSNAINYRNEDFYFYAVAQGNRVILKSKLGGTRFNKLNLSIENLNNNSIETEDDLLFFKGGTSIKNRVKISKDYINIVKIGDYIETKTGYTKILSIVKNTSEPIYNFNNSIKEFSNIDDYVLITENTDIKLDTLNKIAIYKPYLIPFGRLSFFPLKDFDFDFFSQEYAKENELLSEIEEYNTYLQTTGNTLIPYGKSSHPDIYDFYENGFGTLQPLLQSDGDSGAPAKKLFNEYDRLNENYIKELCNVSRIIPFINKWVYKDGKDVRNNDYRLNTSSSFGTYNFSPSKDVNYSDSNSYTHEWYYLSKIPNYFNVEATKNSWSYFNTNIEDNFKPTFGAFEPGTFQDIVNDNFTDYFIVDNLELNGSLVNLNKQFRYSIFNGGDSNNYSQCFFRGIKVSVKERADNIEKINYNINNIKCNKNNKFNGYKFSSILVPNQINKPAVEYKIIRNRKWKTITLVIFTKINYEYFDNNEYVDRTMLYSLKSIIKPVENGFEELPQGGYDYEDIQIDGAINFQKGSIVNGVYHIVGDTDFNGIPANFIRDIKVGPNGKYNRIEFTTFNGLNNFVIDDILEIKSNNVIIANKFTNNGAPVLSLPTLAIPKIQWGKAIYTTINGGYKILENILNDVSFASIYRKINEGDPSVIYEDVDENGNISYDTFLLELRDGDLILKAEYLTSISDQEKPVQFNLIDTVGYRLSLDSTAKIIPFFRHSGNYTPKFKDIFKFVDPYLINSNSEGITVIQESIKNLCRHKNTQFDINDLYFGIIQNMFYHKVNTINPGSILELSSNSAFNSRYPLINEVAIDKRDLYIFSSNWDPGFYIENINKDNISYSIGTRSMKEEELLYTNKYLKVPNSIQLEKFSISNFEISLLNDINSIPSSILYNEFNNTIELYCFIEKEIINFIYNNSIKEFQKYINPNYGIGTLDSIEDDIKKYIELNIIKLYTIDYIDLYVQENRNLDSTNFTYINSDNNIKIQEGLIPINTFTTEAINSSNFNFKIIYNKNIGFNYNIAISIKLVKK